MDEKKKQKIYIGLFSDDVTEFTEVGYINGQKFVFEAMKDGDTIEFMVTDDGQIIDLEED